MGRREPSARAILRIVGIVVLSAIALYLIYLLRKPIGWIAMAVFIAVAVSAPVNQLNRRMSRGLAIAIVYVGLILVPFGLAALVVPPMITQATHLANDVPTYADDVKEYVQKNKRLREFDNKYDITGELQKQAGKLPAKIGDAAKILGDIGLGLVNSIFALVNIMILSIFLVARGRDWVEAGLRLRPEHEHDRWRRILDRTAAAVSGYVQGALTVALIAGVQTYIVLTILGVPFSAPLAVLAGAFSLIPLVGATIAAILIGLVTLFTNFPTATIIWAIWAVVYQQIENNVIQPQIQRRTVQIQPFFVLVAVLFGSTLLGVVGALVAIPLAATIQILLQEWWRARAEARAAEADEGPPPSAEGTAGAMAPVT
jgi:predicted PurR-regulated permease PerM